MTPKKIMNHAAIKNITSTHYRKLKKILREIEDGFAVEAIHQFRVEYKKLRAFLRLLSPGKENSGTIKIAGNLKRAYGICGVIRDLQLQRLRIEDAAKCEPKQPLAYYNLLEKLSDRLKLKLLHISSQDPVGQSKKKTGALLPDDLRQRTVTSFIKRKKAIVRTIISSGHFSDENIHAIRKIIKDLYYNLKIVTDNENSLPVQTIRKDKDDQYVPALLHKLGIFQDSCTSLSLLKPFFLIQLNSYNRKLLEQIKKNWIKEKKTLKLVLVTQLNTMDIS